MPKFEKLTLPNEGEIITFNQCNPKVPNNPIVPFIRGDGTGVDIWPATQIVPVSYTHLTLPTTNRV